MTNTKTDRSIAISETTINGERFFKIANSDAMRPFFMSIVSDSDHWMFISSNGGLTAGRRNAEYALFPYYTDDKITEGAETTGSKTILRVEKSGQTQVWEPFSIRNQAQFDLQQNLYKNIYGDKVLFEEVNHGLGLSFRYQWSSSDRYGFVRTANLINLSDNHVSVAVLDGIQNILPYGLSSEMQTRTSNLADAYKRTELDPSSGLGIFALSAIIVDKAEPSEALKANVVWSTGVDNPTILLSPLQLDRFRKTGTVQGEVDIKGEKGAYLIHTKVQLAAQENQSWHFIADVNKNHAAIAALSNEIRSNANLVEQLQEDIALGTQNLIGLTAASDGIQLGADGLRNTRHFSNTLFNIMRGGIFDDAYQIEKADFLPYLAKANKQSFIKAEERLNQLPEKFDLQQLRELAEQSGDPHFQRLVFEYLPLKFSRRHGDPSRPWNKFSINTRNESDGSKVLDYEGNWRDIFQNWEALGYSYPNYFESMIHKFLNASTFDGYNPYRVTKGGFDWEIIEPDDPWSYIGYWGDHQIIYLLKFLEASEKFHPGTLARYFEQDLFVYANVPYQIKAFPALLANPKDTIDFDHDSDQKIRAMRGELGADGALLQNSKGVIHNVNFIEKILATVLAKLSNFIPEGGIWMNTQRPEWNDANNALVGNGVSMVTLYYLRRFLKFFEGLFAEAALKEVTVSEELAGFFTAMLGTFNEHESLLQGPINDQQRAALVTGLGEAGSNYRMHIYENGFSGNKTTLNVGDLRAFVSIGLKHLEHAIRANKRSDKLYHAYNLMGVEEDGGISIDYLSEMLEGQVAVLSAGYLSGEEALQVLDGMKESKLFRPDQYSYLLYPNKELPGFLQRNTIPTNTAEASSLVQELLKSGDSSVVEKDINGVYHFNGNLRNANDLAAAIDALPKTTLSVSAAQRKELLGIFEAVFNHKAFTGRSGTFYGYEGLGSIYWHMVSKLLLAVQECCLAAIEEGASPVTVGKLMEHYYEINAGIGVHKEPELYGAFSTDPYSHTPGGKGAQQPGMTGQVKEDILSRFGELGIHIQAGQLHFKPQLLRKSEFLTSAESFSFIDVAGQEGQLTLAPLSLGFTYCQVPVVYQIGDQNKVTISRSNGESDSIEGHGLSQADSAAIFSRNGAITQLNVQIKEALLR
ncbi:MAG: hypothetical protein AAF242_00815 [Bacteroidota bacterium]